MNNVKTLVLMAGLMGLFLLAGQLLVDHRVWCSR